MGKAFGEKSQGSRCQIPADFDRIANPPTRSLLQDQARLAAHLEVRVLHRLRPGRLRTKTTTTTKTTTKTTTTTTTTTTITICFRIMCMTKPTRARPIREVLINELCSLFSR